MSQHIMGSPSKKVRHESTSSSYLGNHAPESPIQQTSTGANPDQSLLDFEFSDTPTFNGGGTPTLSYLPSIVPNSKDWIMSPTATFSAVPEGFGADPLSPGFSSGVPSRTASLKLGNNGHARPFRNAHKRGGGAGSNSSLYDESEFEELNGASGGVSGLSAGIALSPGAAVMDEESQEHLSTNKKALADILSRKNYRGGRATPDVGLATSEELQHPHQQNHHQNHQQNHPYQSEGTRLGLGSSQRGSVGSHSNLSYSNSTYSHSNHSHSNLSHSNLSASQAGHSQSHSQGSSNGQFTTSFANFSASTAQGGTSGGGSGASLFELAAAQASLSGIGANKSTSSSRTASNSSKTTGVEIKTEKGVKRSQGESTTATTASTNTNSGGVTGMEEDGLESRGEEEEGDDNSSNHHSQQSATSHMAGVLAITAAAEYLPFPSSDERAPAGSNKTARAGGGTPGKKSKPRRSYGNTSSSTSASFSAEGLKSEQLHDGEHSNLSCESNSSGHSGGGGGGGGVHGSGVKSSASVATSASAISANFLATYGTPAMKLTSSIAASASSSKPITCNCKRSKCLKMYCDCFRLTLYCKDSCRCKECANVESKAAERQAAISSIVERNPEAFKPRVTADPVSNSKGHLTGCHCRKSSCLKKYCECFTGAVPCGERCRCLDCKNAPAIYGSDLKHRLSLSSALGAPGIDRSNPRKDSIGSEGNMDVMSAIMNDKQQRGFGSSGLRTDLATHSLGSPHMMSSSMALMSGGGLSGLGGAPYFDPEMSNLSTASLSYSNEAFHHHHSGSNLSGLGYADLTSHGFLHKAASSSKLGGGLGSLGNLGSLGAPFSPPRPGTDPSSGANSNRSVLDNDEAAEVLSVMNSPNAYMTIPPFGNGGSNNNGSSHGLQDADMTTAGPMFRYRDGHLGSHTGMSSAGSTTQGSLSRPRAFGASKSLLRAEDFDDEDDEGEDGNQHVPVSAPGSVVRHTASMALASALSIDTEDAPTAAAATVSGSSAYFSPSASAYSSPVKPRRPITELAVQSPTLLHLAALCEQQEELEKDRTFASPSKTRSYP